MCAAAKGRFSVRRYVAVARRSVPGSAPSGRAGARASLAATLTAPVDRLCEVRMSRLHQLRSAALLAALLAGCTSSRDRARADSAQAAAEEQLRLTNQLAAQKDSLTNIVLDADRFISQVDSQISRVKGLKTPKRSDKKLESPIQEQLEQRKIMLARVKALVERAQATASQLAESRKREKKLRGENAVLREQVDGNEKLIADLGATIERQTATIAGLQSQVDSLTRESQRLGEEMRTLATTNSKAYYIIGRERDLIEKGVIVREGGANLLIAHPGRTLQIARSLPLDEFTTVDSRGLKDIAVPDSNRRYVVVSRQSLDNAQVAERKRNSFRGNLHIADAGKFWAPSKYLVLVEQ
jgi:hypothetical protein